MLNLQAMTSDPRSDRNLHRPMLLLPAVEPFFRPISVFGVPGIRVGIPHHRLSVECVAIPLGRNSGTIHVSIFLGFILVSRVWRWAVYPVGRPDPPQMSHFVVDLFGY